MRNSRRGRKLLILAAVALLIILLGQQPRFLGGNAVFAEEAGQQPQQASLDNLLPLVGGSLVAAGSANWDEASDELQQFAKAWNGLAADAPEDVGSQITAGLKAANAAITAKDKEKAGQALSALAKEVNVYVENGSETSGNSGQTADAGKQSARDLLQMSKQVSVDLAAGDIAAAKQHYKVITGSWSRIETPIRQSHFGLYSKLETQMSLIRVALQAEPPKAEQAAALLTGMNAQLQDYIDGKLSGQQDAAPADGSLTLADAVKLLSQSLNALDTGSGDIAAAQDPLSQFIAIWPSVEGEVSISSPSAYQNTENQMTEALGFLSSEPPAKDKAGDVLQQMIAELEPISRIAAYSAWDAAAVMLREGLEAILVLAALLAFAKRAGNTAARSYIWSGAGTGLALSAILAVLLTYTISKAASGGTRELTEGITGLFAVVMMLTVGAWLHGKSNAKAWNDYMAKQVGGALARGSLWSLFALSGLAILREGAETTIFYIGMAPSISIWQLVTGIAAAAILLAVIGFCIIRFSVKLPIRPFFLTATVLIYYLVLRFLGESLHALQIAGKLPAHAEPSLPDWGWIGFYPTWETFVPQVLLLLYVIWELVPKRRSSSKTAEAH